MTDSTVATNSIVCGGASSGALTGVLDHPESIVFDRPPREVLPVIREEDLVTSTIALPEHDPFYKLEDYEMLKATGKLEEFYPVKTANPETDRPVILHRQYAVGVTPAQEVELANTRKAMEKYCFKEDDFYNNNVSEHTYSVEDIDSDTDESCLEVTFWHKKFIQCFTNGTLKFENISMIYPIEHLIEESIPSRLIYMMSIGLLDHYFKYDSIESTRSMSSITSVVNRMMIAHKDNLGYINLFNTDGKNILDALILYWPFKNPETGHRIFRIEPFSDSGKPYITFLEYIMQAWPEYFEDVVKNPLINVNEHDGCIFKTAITYALKSPMDWEFVPILVRTGVNYEKYTPEIRHAVIKILQSKKTSPPFIHLESLFKQLLDKLPEKPVDVKLPSESNGFLITVFDE
jgi:hypothetical protein